MGDKKEGRVETTTTRADGSIIILSSEDNGSTTQSTGDQVIKPGD